ncbi:MAG: M14 family zinc carboxypeptidase, partial [Planctomycetota bacterium]
MARWIVMLAALWIAGSLFAASGDRREEDDRIVRVTVRDARDLGTLGAVGANPLVCELSSGSIPVLVGADAIGVLESAGLAPVIVDHDPHGTARAVRERALATLARGDQADWWADYKPLDAFYAKMEEMQARRPDLVELFEFGRSHEDRPLLAMRITAPVGPDAACRPAVLLNSLTHAREWVPPMANMYVAETLINGYGSDPYLTGLLDAVEWVFVPVLNPDGYEFSWTDNRFWRKNRNTEGFTQPSAGVDLNRNYGYRWGQTGSSGFRGSQTYRGIAPFSESETSAIRDLALSMPQLRIHNDMHSFSELILFPWGYTPEPSPADALHQSVGDEMARRIAQLRGRFYEVGPGYTTIYPTSGAANDWYYGRLGVLSYTYELGRRFDEDPAEMRVLVEESLPASLYHGDFVAEHYTFRADINRDCRHDFFDLAEYLGLFGAGSDQADLDGSGVLDIDD